MEVNQSDNQADRSENNVTPKSGLKHIVCNFCEDTFDSIRSLMIHKKSHHTEKISACWKFLAGHCEYGEKLCWFSHVQREDNSESKEVNCNICNKTFNTFNNYRHHKKQEHRETVRQCNQNKNKDCKFGDLNCWFHHENDTNLYKKDNQEVTEKMFSMMEKFTKRIVDIENHMNDKN